MSNNANELSIQEIKEKLDIITVAEKYGELIKAGKNFYYKDNKSITFEPAKQIFSDFGSGNIKGGSVLDLIMFMENIKEMKDGITRLKELAGCETFIIKPSTKLQNEKEAKKAKEVDFYKLNLWSKNSLNAGHNKKPIQLEEDGVDCGLLINSDYKKLFETSTLPTEFLQKTNYIFKNILGFDDFYKCPSIIIRDNNYNVVDLIAYRPVKPTNYEKWNSPKYLYKNSHNRGENFLYPFRKEVESILAKNDYIIIGEGIKNGLNALIYSVPFITLESTSNNISQTLLSYISDYARANHNLICMFDGDYAGAKAYLNFIKSYYPNTKNNIENFIKNKENIVLPDKSNESIVLSNYITFINKNSFQINNFLEFDSGIDFVEYLQSGVNK